VLVLADDPLTRAGLTALLSAQEELFVLAELSPDDDVAAFAEGVDAAVWEADAEVPETLDLPLLALVRDAEEAAQALRAGARGVLGRSADGERILAALGVLTRGLAVLEPAFLPAPRSEPEGLEPLTPRERDVLNLLAEGLSNKAIAKRLGVSDHTVKFHLNALLGKLGARSRTEAVTKAVRSGLLTL